MIGGARERWRVAQSAVAEQHARRSARAAGVALVYHRVAAASGALDLELNPALGRAEFRRELAYLGERYRVVAPSALRSAIEDRRAGEALPVAITFDDDTRSHVDEAFPALAELGFVAGFYVRGSALAGATPPWWETLQLTVDHARIDSADSPLPREAIEAALRKEPRAIRRLGALVELLEPEARRSLQDDLAARTRGLAIDAGLDEEALRTLGARHEVGFHTRPHDRLVPLSGEELSHALTDGRAELESVVGAVEAIAYPHGDADERVAAAAAAAGYTLGLAGFNRAAAKEDAALLLPRLSPTHESLGTFALTVARATLAC